MKLRQMVSSNEMNTLLVELKVRGIEIEDNRHLNMGFMVSSQPFRYCSIIYRSKQFYLTLISKTLDSDLAVEAADEIGEVAKVVAALNIRL